MLKRHCKFFPALFVYAVYQLLKLILTLLQVLDLVGQKFVPLFKFSLFVDSIDIDIAKTFDLASQHRNLLPHLIPVDLAFFKALIRLFQIQTKLFGNSLGQILVLDSKLTKLKLYFVNLLFDL